jgi:hypothetical protein
MTKNQKEDNRIFLKTKVTSVCLDIYKYLKKHNNGKFTVKLATGQDKGLICDNISYPPREFDYELAELIRKHRISKYGPD